MCATCIECFRQIGMGWYYIERSQQNDGLEFNNPNELKRE